MSALNSIREVIALMKDEEIKVARDFLSSFSSRGKNSKNISLQLFDHLYKERNSETKSSPDELEFFLYGNYEETGFTLLVLRLLDKIEESLLLNINLNRKEALSERGNALYQIRKKLSVANLIFNRGAKNHATALFKFCIKNAEKYEYFEELATATRYYSHVLLFQNSIKEHELIKEKNEKAIRSIQAIKKAEYYYNLLVIHTEYKASPVDLTQLEKQTIELQFDLRQTGSAQVGYYLYYIETHLYQQKKQFKRAAKSLEEQLQYVKHPAVFSPSTHNLVLLNIAWNELYIHRFKQSLKITKELSNYRFSSNYFTYQVHQVAFYSYFYMGDLVKASYELDEMELVDNADKSAEFRKGKRLYFRACIHFINKDFSSVQNILRELNAIEDDDLGWNIHLRILYIITDIERGEFDFAYNKIESLRKHIEKNNRKKDLPQRLILIYEILKTLSNSDFDFVKTKNKKNEDLSGLHSTENQWEILSPEMIIFQNWFEQKQYKQFYQIKTPQYNEVINK